MSRTIAAALIASSCVLAIVAFTPLTLWVLPIFRPERATPGQPPPQGTALIVLGTAVRDDGSLDVEATERIDAALEGWKSGAAPLVVFSGGTDTNGYNEASVMKQRAIEDGLPTQAAILEARSENTHENACFTADLLRGQISGQVIVVTQPYHLGRALRMFAHCGLPAAPWPIRHSYAYTGFPRDRLRLAFTESRETLAWIKAWLRRWI